MKSTLAYATYFGVVGPLIGCMVLLAVVMPFLHGLGHHDEWYGYVLALLSILAMSVLMMPAAFVIGVIPGVLTGIAYAWLCSRTHLPRLPRFVRAVLVAPIGGAACTIFGWALGAAVSDMWSLEVLQLFLIPGMSAAFLCTLLADRGAALPAPAL